jgi:hypothetical protein
MPVLSCIRCDKKMNHSFCLPNQEISGIDSNIPSDGIAFSSNGNYGSTYFDSSGTIQINICDVCMKIAEKKKQILIVSDQMLIFYRSPIIKIDRNGVCFLDKEADKIDQEEFDKLPQI